MISEDWGLMTNYENFKILNTEAFLYLLNVNEKLNISKLLADLHFVGVNVTWIICSNNITRKIVVSQIHLTNAWKH